MIVLGAVLACCATTEAGQEPKGAFFKAETAGQPNLYVYLAQEGNAITGADLRTGAEIFGAVQGGAVNFTIDAKAAVAAKKTVTFKGNLSDPMISGMVKFSDGVSHPIVIFRLPSLWQCSHKDPTHVADSEEQMRDLSAKQGCTGWHKAIPPAKKGSE
jgi:hypothetical protein